MNYSDDVSLNDELVDFFRTYKDKFCIDIQQLCAAIDFAPSKEFTDFCEVFYSALFIEQYDEKKFNMLVAIGRKYGAKTGVFFEALLLLQAEFSQVLSKKSALSNQFCSNHVYSNFISISAAALRAFLCVQNHPMSTADEDAQNENAQANASFGFHDDFLDAIEKLAQSGEQLEFLNLYNGVPVRTFSKSLKIENGILIAELDLTQILAMKEENCAYIVQNSHINTNMRANILWVNTTSCTAALNKFEPQQFMHALKRKYPRVHPNKFTRVSLNHADGRSISGKMYDISQGGMGVVSTEEVGFKSGDVLTSDVELANGADTLFLHLQFRLVVCISYQSAYRYCLQIDSNIQQPDAALIEGFAKTREAQTIEELSALIEQYKD